MDRWRRWFREWFEKWGCLTLLVLFFLMTGVVSSMRGDRRPSGAGGDCYIEWDGRSNPTVCD